MIIFLWCIQNILEEFFFLILFYHSHTLIHLFRYGFRIENNTKLEPGILSVNKIRLLFADFTMM